MAIEPHRSQDEHDAANCSAWPGRYEEGNGPENQQANPRRGGRRYIYRAVPNVQKAPGGRLLLNHPGEAHRFASVLGERVRV